MEQDEMPKDLFDNETKFFIDQNEPKARLPPKDFLIFSIVVFLLGLNPFGLLSMLFSIQSHFASKRGQKAEARHYGHIAFKINLIGLMIWIVLFIAIIVFFVSKRQLNHNKNFIHNNSTFHYNFTSNYRNYTQEQS
jgi:hypothetical protein